MSEQARKKVKLASNIVFLIASVIWLIDALICRVFTEGLMSENFLTFAIVSYLLNFSVLINTVKNIRASARSSKEDGWSRFIGILFATIVSYFLSPLVLAGGIFLRIKNIVEYVQELKKSAQEDFDDFNTFDDLNDTDGVDEREKNNNET